MDLCTNLSKVKLSKYYAIYPDKNVVFTTLLLFM